jgi:hypothetical protein
MAQATPVTKKAYDIKSCSIHKQLFCIPALNWKRRQTKWMTICLCVFSTFPLLMYFADLQEPGNKLQPLQVHKTQFLDPWAWILIVAQYNTVH